ISLNLTITIAKTEIIEEIGIKHQRSQLDAIDQAEKRQRFKDLMQELNEPVTDSKTVETVQEALDFAAEIGYPVIVRPAFTMGGTGGGLCDNPEQLKEIVANGLELSPATQCLIEKSIMGYKEIE